MRGWQSTTSELVAAWKAPVFLSVDDIKSQIASLESDIVALRSSAPPSGFAPSSSSGPGAKQTDKLLAPLPAVISIAEMREGALQAMNMKRQAAAQEMELAQREREEEERKVREEREAVERAKREEAEQQRRTGEIRVLAETRAATEAHDNGEMGNGSAQDQADEGDDIGMMANEDEYGDEDEPEDEQDGGNDENINTGGGNEPMQNGTLSEHASAGGSHASDMQHQLAGNDADESNDDPDAYLFRTDYGGGYQDDGDGMMQESLVDEYLNQMGGM